MSKKQSKRSRIKYPALDPSFNLKSRTELIDYDYIDKLDEKDKKFLNTFTEEYTNAKLNHRDKKLHKTKKLKKDCFDRNNARNRCIYNKEKKNNRLLSLTDLINEKDTKDSIEDKLINELDKKASFKKT